MYRYYMQISFVVVLFFFFKQKTAYEMRISDWSSDVCSSDLTTSGRVRRPSGRSSIGIFVDQAKRVRSKPFRAISSPKPASVRSMSASSQRRRRHGRMSGPMSTLRLAPSRELLAVEKTGRASSGARRGRSADMSVGAVTLKKQKEE